MDHLNPIYTDKTECQDCCKCVRECPVKAIKVENGCATVQPELCVLCGHCVQVCPNGAKRARNDLQKARNLLASKRKVVVSLAPSFISEFSGVKPEVMVAALRRLGFAAVSETALGAEEVSAGAAQALSDGQPRTVISSACPVVVQFVKKYMPALGGKVANMLSPLLAHCRLLRQEYGADIGVVFIGPCIAKKLEADQHPQLLNAALTFEELRGWFEAEGLDLASVTAGPNDVFQPRRAKEGALYPVDGGMIAGVKPNCAVDDAEFMSFSGVKNIRDALEGIEASVAERRLFLECLACEGGCVNGPKASSRKATVVKRLRVFAYAERPGTAKARKPAVDVHEAIVAAPAPRREYSESEIQAALQSIGKFGAADELNCGGCGYDSCRECAKALIAGKAERTMCLTYMRKLAQKKANRLLATMSSAAVIVDRDLKIIECNRNFARLFGEETEMVYDAKPGMERAALDRIVPFHRLFRHVLDTGEDILDRDVKHGDAILHVSIFSVEEHNVVGAILRDVTEPVVQKERIVAKAREVIERNLATVQRIAYLLGENAADSEVILNSIIGSFSPDPVEDGGRPAGLPPAPPDIRP